MLDVPAKAFPMADTAMMKLSWRKSYHGGSFHKEKIGAIGVMNYGANYRLSGYGHD
jgi:hypothetical protein